MGPAERARVARCLRRFERATRPSPRAASAVAAVQERGGGGQAAAGPPARRISFQFGGDLLAGRPPLGQVPGPLVRVSARVADRGEGGMRMAPVCSAGPA